MMPGPAPAYRGDGAFVFVSYSHKDEESVYQLISTLQEQGLNVWYDASGISAGAEWNDEIARAIKAADAFLYFITPSSAASEHCRRELSFAQSQGQRVIAAHLAETDIPDGLRLSLDNRQAILAYRMTPDETTHALLRALGESEQTQASNRPEPSADRFITPGFITPRRVAGTVAIALIAMVAIWFWHTDERSTTRQDQSIAVLPFTDLSPGGDQQHFGDGIAEEILNELTGLEGLRVIARTTSFAHRQQREDLATIARTLGVTAILDGSIRRQGERVRITAQLINAEDGFNLWSETFERQLTDIFAIQDEIAAAVAGVLGVTLGVGDINAYSGAGTTSIEAYEAFLQARNLVAGSATSNEAVRLLLRATTLDPDYAAAWALLGLTTASTMWERPPEDAPKILDVAIEYLMRAVALEPNSAYAYALLGTVNYARMDWIQSEEYFQKSLAIAPNPVNLRHYGNMLMRSGRSRSAIDIYESVSLPTPLAASGYHSLGVRNVSGVSDASMESANSEFLQFVVSLSGDNPANVASTLRNLPGSGQSWTDFVESLLPDVSDPKAALLTLRATLDDADAIWPGKYNVIALLAAHFGDPELALESLEREARLTTIRHFTHWYPVLRDVRKLAGFRKLVREINLVEYWQSYGWSDHCRPIGVDDFECY